MRPPHQSIMKLTSKSTESLPQSGIIMKMTHGYYFTTNACIYNSELRDTTSKTPGGSSQSYVEAFIQYQAWITNKCIESMTINHNWVDKIWQAFDNILIACKVKDMQCLGTSRDRTCLYFRYIDRKNPSLYFLNLKWQAPSHVLWLHSLVCVGPGRKCRFSHDAAHIKYVTLVKSSFQDNKRILVFISQANRIACSIESEFKLFSKPLDNSYVCKCVFSRQ